MKPDFFYLNIQNEYDKWAFVLGKCKEQLEVFKYPAFYNLHP